MLIKTKIAICNLPVKVCIESLVTERNVENGHEMSRIRNARVPNVRTRNFRVRNVRPPSINQQLKSTSKRMLRFSEAVLITRFSMTNLHPKKTKRWADISYLDISCVDILYPDISCPDIWYPRHFVSRTFRTLNSLCFKLLV